MGDSLNEGDADERPVHTVALDVFYMGRYEVTNQRFSDFLNSAMAQGSINVANGRVYKSGSGTSYPYCDTTAASEYSHIEYNNSVFSVRHKGGRNMADDPVVMVYWYGAAAYCNWRSTQEGRDQCYDAATWQCNLARKGYRLPTEAEWESAARGGLSGRRLPWGDTITHGQANYKSSASYAYDVSPTRDYHPAWNDNIWPYTSPVGSFAPNAYGLCDTAVNMWVGCTDWYASTYYTSSPTHNPAGPTTGSHRVLRGGDWYDNATYCRNCSRQYYAPGGRGSSIGFRVVLDWN